MMSENLDDTSYWAGVAAEELAAALRGVGIRVLDCDGDEDGVSIAFPNLATAEALMTVAVPAHATPGTLYDRATGSCVALRVLSEQHDGDVPEEDATAAIRDGWAWIVHPHMIGRVMDWHVSVTLPHNDANQITANLNSLRLGGAL